MEKFPKQIGITGGIGSGKSLICKVFNCLGVPIYDADTRAKWLMSHKRELIESIKETFGPQSYSESGDLNRQYLAANVFSDQDKLQQLNGLVHPAVGEDYKEWVGKHGSSAYVIKEAALLFESGSYKSLDTVITIYAPVALRIKRTLMRDTQRNEKEVLAIIDKQLPESERQAKADFTIKNDDTTLVLLQVLKLHEKFMD
ncbi:dephospho-CoA kinase [Fulvivirgaceae bacterium BMA10]|uniref:Dephospho-CoA kinase n=1 Tax=Splendidivirga corallicola TaxID=3051826 RepID=A0ABT8KKD9_9BACT|nr:dephospho-CoA kinase [Fulvivirgaceae bacterium BMA10]